MHQNRRHSTEFLIRDSVDSEDRILVLVGMFAQCMRDIVKLTAEAVGDLVGRNYTILAPTARIARHYCHADRGVYGLIYERNAHYDKKREKFIHEMKENSSSENHHYIVGDAHLISNSRWVSDSRQFGSGCLLNDFMDFVDLKESERRIIFIGDPYQMRRQSDASSALTITKLQEYSKSVKRVQLKEYRCNMGSELFLENRELLADRIQTRQFHRLAISLNDTDCVQLSDVSGNMDQLIKGHDAITIAHTNLQVNTYNQEIRSRIFGRQSELTEGDLVVTNNALSINCDECAKRCDVHAQYYDLPSGSFGIVKTIQGEEQLVQPLKGRPRPVTVNFLNVRIQWKHIGCEHHHKHLCFRDYLYTEKPGIDKDAMIAMIVHAREEQKQSDASSEESSDKEFLDSRFLRAAMLRFGYAVTLHKAQGCLYKTVIADLSSENLEGGDGYFRWLYTAFSVPSKSLNLINLPRKSPFGRTVWQLDQGRLTTRISPTSLIEYDPSASAPQDIKEFPTERNELRNLYSFLSERLKRIHVRVTKLVHHPYQEVYTFEMNGRSTCTIQFHYNSKFQITRLSVQKSKPSDFAGRIRGVLISDPTFEDTFQKGIYDILSHRLESHDIRITGVEHRDFQEVYYIEGDQGRARFSAYYNNKGAVTKIILTSYNAEKFKEYLQTIFQA